MKSLLASLALFFLTCHISTRAQSSVWNESKTAKKVTDRATKTKKKFKDFKSHLQNWGLDTSYKHAFYWAES